jgi:ubiquinone/menaquinone biosynthesis C-methylase UbiE
MAMSGEDSKKAATDERQRIRSVYATYDSEPREQRKRDMANRGLRAILEERDRIRSSLLEAEGFLPLRGRRILDLGCGRGDELADLVAAGARERDCAGVDLLPERIEQARERLPEAQLFEADARGLPFAENAFDLVLASTLFSSILLDSVAGDVATEIARVLRPDGALVWYDARYPTPWNKNVRPYSLAHIRALFPGWTLRSASLTVLPPLARRLSSATRLLYPVFAAAAPLRGRYLVVLRKSPRAP